MWTHKGSTLEGKGRFQKAKTLEQNEDKVLKNFKISQFRDVNMKNVIVSIILNSDVFFSTRDFINSA